MILTGAIQNTHYNLIDTFINLIPKWNEYATKLIPIIKENEDSLTNRDNSLATTSLLRLSDSKEVENIFPYDSYMRYTIIECMVWGYFQGYRVG